MHNNSVIHKEHYIVANYCTLILITSLVTPERNLGSFLLIIVADNGVTHEFGNWYNYSFRVALVFYVSTHYVFACPFF